MAAKKIVIIDGCRTPFLRSGSDYADLMSWQLGMYAIKGLLNRTGIDPNEVDRVIYGTTISNIKTGNVAREAAVSAGIPQSVPCHTVTQACISANQAITSGIEAILAGQAEVIIAGGVDNVSDAPIQFPKKMRKKLFNAQKLKGIGDMLKFASTLRPSDFFPERPAIAEYLTNRTMGQDCELLVGKYHVSREEQDAFALRSHLNAAASIDILKSEIEAVLLPPKFKRLDIDNGIRGDSTIEKLAKLSPAFDKQYGTLTAANASFLTDGASAILIMTEEKAKALGLTPKASVLAYAYSAQNMAEELLLGPTYAIAKVLKQCQLSLQDMDVIELHEAFAGQVLANIKCLNSDQFAKSSLGLDKAIGEVDMNKLNKHGGSLAIGHPFGATGARLVTTCANRLNRENGRYALLAACAAGALGHAMIIERYST
jgi:acetyl-CoA acyltransferase